MPRVKQASKQKRTTKAAAVTVLGATGLGFSLLARGNLWVNRDWVEPATNLAVPAMPRKRSNFRKRRERFAGPVRLIWLGPWGGRPSYERTSGQGSLTV